jgi:hypothetical protein
VNFQFSISNFRNTHRFSTPFPFFAIESKLDSVSGSDKMVAEEDTLGERNRTRQRKGNQTVERPAKPPRVAGAA